MRCYQNLVLIGYAETPETPVPANKLSSKGGSLDRG